MPALTHRHATHGPCRTVCGRPCSDVETVYDDDDVTCPSCAGLLDGNGRTADDYETVEPIRPPLKNGRPPHYGGRRRNALGARNAAAARRKGYRS